LRTIEWPWTDFLLSRCDVLDRAQPVVRGRVVPDGAAAGRADAASFGAGALSHTIVGYLSAGGRRYFFAENVW